jgi:hypothetical protein
MDSGRRACDGGITRGRKDHGQEITDRGYVLEEILRRVDALPPLDDRPEDEILGYDHEGLPR